MPNELVKGGLTSLAFAALGYLVGAVVAHLFVWTLAAGDPGIREALTQIVAVAASAGCACACLLLRAHRESIFSGATPIKSKLLWAVSLWLVVGLIASICVWGWHGEYGGAEFVRSWLIIAPLAAGVFAVLGLLMAHSTSAASVNGAATVAGMSIGYLMLWQLGNFWIVVLTILAPGAGLLLKKFDVIRHDDGVVKASLILALGAMVYHVVLGPLIFAWTAATTMTLFATVWASTRAARVFWDKGDSIAPQPSPAQPAGDRTVMTWLGDRLHRTVRSFGAREMLVFAWLTLLFITHYWAQPAFEAEPMKPFTMKLPEPSPPPQTFGLSMSEIYAHYSAEWDAYNAHEFNSWRENQDYRETAALTEAWNDSIRGAVFARWIIKFVAWSVVLLLTLSYGRRYERMLAKMEPAVSIS